MLEYLGTALLPFHIVERTGSSRRQTDRFPFMNADDVDTANWLRSLGEVAKLAPKFIIPGHGRPSSKAGDAVAFTRDYITYGRAAMGKAAEH